MKPFLQSIAEAYAANEHPRELARMIFIFPNKRAATFFNHYLAATTAAAGTTAVHPRTMSVVEFAEGFADGFAQADRLEMVFILYDVYRRAVRRHSGPEEADKVDFNRFVFWADTLLQDFDDVDNALADPSEVFRNVTTLKEISANYITPEQAREIKRYWRDFDLQPDETRFWNHLAYAGEASANTGDSADADTQAHTSPSAGFLKLWQVMGEVYTAFRSLLREKGLYTSGMNFRDAAEKLRKTSADELPYHRYVFVGFNNLSTAEHTVFTRLASLRHPRTGMPMADFYWDTASPAFDRRGLPGIEKVMRYAETFPSLYDCVEPLTEFPRIYIVGVPSRVGQCKAIGHALGKIFPPDETHDGKADPALLRRTALVLPDEQLLTPLVNSLPAAISPVNLTMGYKLRNTSVASLLRAIVTLQMRAFRRGQTSTFYIDDVTRVLTHPLVRSASAATVDVMLMQMQKERLFNVPEHFFMRHGFELFRPLFTMVANKQSCDDVFTYLRNLLKWLDEALARTWSPLETAEAAPTATGQPEAGEYDSADEYDPLLHLRQYSGTDRSLALQQAFIRRYANAVARLKHLRDTYLEDADGRPKVFLEDATVFNLVERVIKGEMLNFEGVPLEGLQVMGVLEARALDFDTIIIPSMNERIFPRSKFGASFIPDVIRRANRLGTSEDQEGAFSYFFYRMISRARQVHLIYDARTSGTHVSEPSRFIQQLQQIFRPQEMTAAVLPYRLVNLGQHKVEVAKTPDTMRKLQRYFSDDDPLYLSASSIESLLGCPVAFYLEKIAGYKDTKDMVDWMDEGTYGEIVHQVFEHLFNTLLRYATPGKGVIVDTPTIEALINNTPLLSRLITRSINELHLNLKETDLNTPLTGDCLILHNLILIIVKASLRRELDFTPFVYHHSEWQNKMRLTIDDGASNTRTFNLNLKIDRVDRLSDGHEYPRLRIVDYKTGGDSTSATNVEGVFGNYKTKAFLQLMIYCQAYAQKEGYTGPIQPLIYPVRNAIIKPYTPLRWSKPLKAEATDPAETIERCDLKQPVGKEKKWKVLDYRDYLHEFNARLIKALDDLLDPEKPFTSPESDDACKYCNFREICRREIKF